MNRENAFGLVRGGVLVTILMSAHCTDTQGGYLVEPDADPGQVVAPACDPDSVEPCAEAFFVCRDDGAGGKICVSQEPATPGDGAWSCEVVDGRLVCRGDTMPPDATDWTCVAEAGGVVCTRSVSVPDDGGDRPWDCDYQGDLLLCVTDDGTEPGDAGPEPEDSGPGTEDAGVGCGPGQTPPPELCDNGVDDDCDGLADCQDDDCVCDPLREGCRASERIAFIQGASTLADVRPGAYRVDVFTLDTVLADASVLAPYDTVVYYGNPAWTGGIDSTGFDCGTLCPGGVAAFPGMESYCDMYCGSATGGSASVLLEDLYRAGVKVIILSVPMTDGSFTVPNVMELGFHYHDIPVSSATITVSDSNTMSDAFVAASFSGWNMLQYQADEDTPWCGDLFFTGVGGWTGYNGHIHGFRRDDAVYRGILIHVGVYTATSNVVDFSSAFAAAHLEQLWDPGFGLSEACGLSCDVPAGHGVGKPVIYLYPEQEQEVTVNLDFDGQLVTTYPEYDEEIGGWDVIARPDGTLINTADGEEYSYIYWNGVTSSFLPDFSEGFVVPGEDTIEFLQSKLSEIGLLPAEYNELIIYWLPYMEHHAYNLISFAGTEYTELARMTITPEPDSLLRVFMVFRELDEPVSVPEQRFAPFVREGFTVVEWGGSEIGGDWHVVR
jgi:hypothetical protein